MKTSVDVVRKIDLIDFFSLTELVATHHQMARQEAFDWIFKKIMKDRLGEKVRIFNTVGRGLPEVIEEVCLSIDDDQWNGSILFAIAETDFCYNDAAEKSAKEQWFRRHDTYLEKAAILKTDATKLFSLPFDTVSAVDVIDSKPIQQEQCAIEKVQGESTSHEQQRDESGDLGRRGQQHEVILAVIVALKFKPQEIPDGGKAAIKSICLTRPRLFTDASFDHAWKAGLKDELFKLASHQKYAS